MECRNMMILFSSLVTALMCMRAEAAKCDENIIKQINETFWKNGNCVPLQLIRKGVYLTPEVVMIASTNYYPGVDSSTCILSEFDDSVITTTFFFSNGSYYNETRKVSETDGVLHVKGTNIKQYYLFADNYGLTGCYECEEDGEEGDPKAVLRSTTYGFESVALSEAARSLTALGVKLNDYNYEEQCGPDRAF